MANSVIAVEKNVQEDFGVVRGSPEACTFSSAVLVKSAFRSLPVAVGYFPGKISKN